MAGDRPHVVALLAPRGSVLADGAQGGSSVVLLEDAEILARAGYEVRIWAPEGSTAPVVDRAVRIRFPMPLVSSLEY